VLLNKRGKGQVANVNVEDERIIILISDAIRNWYGQIEVGKVGASGKLTI